MAGYSSTPLVKKLGIKPGDTMYISDAPENYFNWIAPLPADVHIQVKLNGIFNFVHLFVRDTRTMEPMVKEARNHLDPAGMIWVSWPKKSARVETDLDENKIRIFALKNGLVDVKVCAVDEVWSGLKLVIPLKQR